MRKMTKKAVSLGLVATMALSMTACNSAQGNNNTTTSAPETTSTTETTSTSTTETSSAAETTTEAAEIVKPEKITVMWDGTIFKEGENYAEDFYKALSDKLGINVEFTRPDHSGYSDQIMLAFADKNNIPDVIILPASYYASLSANGALWDMTDAWKNSDTYNSGRLVSIADKIIDSWYVTGPDGEKHMYGMYPARGNGTVTYVKASWAKAAGYETKEDLPTNWADYQTFLTALKEANGGKAPVMAPGAISSEAPYINYLPEFYQDAYPDFIKDANGQWIDGFTTDAMKAALERLAWGYKEGVLNADIITKTKTADIRNMFYADDFGIFNYWAGTWAYNLKNNLGKNGLDDELWALPAIDEVGGYYERLSPMICITSACKNPEGVFKYFIDTMLDGGDVQMLWMYGVEGVHYEWNEDGKTITGLATQNTAGTDKITKTTKNLFEANLKLANFKEVDPYVSADPVIEESFELFDSTAVIAPEVNMSDVYNDNSSEIWTYRKDVVAKVTLGEMTVEEAMDYYEENVGDIVQEVLDSFNNK